MDRHYVGVNTMEGVEVIRPAYASHSMHHAQILEHFDSQKSM